MGGGVLPAKTCNKDHSFYNTILLKKPHLTNLISLNNAKNILLQQQKFSLILPIFQQVAIYLSMFLVSEKAFALHYF